MLKISNVGEFPGVDFLGTALKFGKREKNLSYLVYSIKREIRHFLVLVVQGRQRNVQKKVLHVLVLTFLLQSPSPSPFLKLSIIHAYGRRLILTLY